MKNQLFLTLGIPAVLAAPVALPHTARAQASCRTTPAQVTIEVDYVTTSFHDFVSESSRIAPGKEHDAQLMAALLKDGAQQTQSPQITTTDGVLARVSTTTLVQKLTLTSFIQVKPRINKNGLITVDMTNHLETLLPVSPPGAVLPSVNTTDVTQTDTFADGQTLMVNSMSTNDANDQRGKPAALLIFAKVKLVGTGLLTAAASHLVNHP